MARKTKKTVRPAPRRTAPAPAKPGELLTLLDYLRYAVSRCNEAELVVAHGTTDPVAEAAFLITETLHLAPEQFETFAQARVTKAEATKLLGLIGQRVRTRKPLAYLVNKIYMRGLPFYVDERVIVPRSFIGELLDVHFSGDSEMPLIEDPGSVGRVLDLCTGSGCLAILAAQTFFNATLDAVDISKDALAVAAKNVADYGLEDRISLHKGDLFAPLGNERYDLINSNPPYVDANGMASLPAECRHAPKHDIDGGADGIDIVRRVVKDAARHLTPNGGLRCEVGRCREAVEDAFPTLPLLWLDTEESEGEMFWIGAQDLAGLAWRGEYVGCK